jgi:hypothetical protein
MAVVFKKTFDELELRDLIAAGYTSMKLYYANSPDQQFVDSAAIVNYTLQQLLDTNTTPYIMTFTYPFGNYSQWFKFIPFGVGVTWENSLSSAFHGGGGVNLLTLRQRLGNETETMIKGTTTANGTPTTAICAFIAPGIRGT